ncbi:hypothetical protein [Pikeienuella sp. HZG-20]|uniref:hypothetical protein n=1 Tax=Paludibacillus litoralis TaxID=3133267 RepID=UPI0030EB27A0
MNRFLVRNAADASDDALLQAIPDAGASTDAIVFAPVPFADDDTPRLTSSTAPGDSMARDRVFGGGPGVRNGGATLRSDNLVVGSRHTRMANRLPDRNI